MPILGPTTVRDSVGMIVDNSYLDLFARVTWHEKEIKDISGNKIDYVGVKATSAIDFRGENMTNFESLEKNSIDFYLSLIHISEPTRRYAIGDAVLCF